MSDVSAEVVSAAMQRYFSPGSMSNSANAVHANSLDAVRDNRDWAKTLLVTACAGAFVGHGSKTQLPVVSQLTLGSTTHFAEAPFFALVECEGSSTGQVFFDEAKSRFRDIAILIDARNEQFATSTTAPMQPSVPGNAGAMLATEGATVFQPVETRRAWLNAAYECSQKGMGRHSLQIVYSAVENYIKDQNFSALDEVLAGVDVSRLSPQVLSGLLRVSSRVGKVLPNWKSLLERVKQELRRGAVKNASALLSGLE